MRRLLKRISIACVGLVVFACPSLLADSMSTVGASVAGLVAYCDGANIVQVDYSKGGANFASVADGRSRSGDCGVPPDNFATGFDARSVAYASGTLKASIFTKQNKISVIELVRAAIHRHLIELNKLNKRKPEIFNLVGVPVVRWSRAEQEYADSVILQHFEEDR
jgi:hypothetical protein